MRSKNTPLTSNVGCRLLVVAKALLQQNHHPVQIRPPVQIVLLVLCLRLIACASLRRRLRWVCGVARQAFQQHVEQYPPQRQLRRYLFGGHCYRLLQLPFYVFPFLFTANRIKVSRVDVEEDPQCDPGETVDVGSLFVVGFDPTSVVHAVEDVGKPIPIDFLELRLELGGILVGQVAIRQVREFSFEVFAYEGGGGREVVINDGVVSEVLEIYANLVQNVQPVVHRERARVASQVIVESGALAQVCQPKRYLALGRPFVKIARNPHKLLRWQLRQDFMLLNQSMPSLRVEVFYEYLHLRPILQAYRQARLVLGFEYFRVEVDVVDLQVIHPEPENLLQISISQAIVLFPSGELDWLPLLLFLQAAGESFDKGVHDGLVEDFFEKQVLFMTLYVLAVAVTFVFLEAFQHLPRIVRSGDGIGLHFHEEGVFFQVKWGVHAAQNAGVVKDLWQVALHLPVHVVN